MLIQYTIPDWAVKKAKQMGSDTIRPVITVDPISVKFQYLGKRGRWIDIKPPFVMPTCPESGKPVNQCRCDKCPIPF